MSKEEEKIDFSQVLNDIHGNPMKQAVPGQELEPGEKPETENVTLKSICVNVLANALKGDDKLEGRAKIRMAKLAEKIEFATKPLGLSKAQVSLICKRAEKAYQNPVTLTRVWTKLNYMSEAEINEE